MAREFDPLGGHNDLQLVNLVAPASGTQARQIRSRQVEWSKVDQQAQPERSSSVYLRSLFSRVMRRQSGPF